MTIVFVDPLDAVEPNFPSFGAFGNDMDAFLLLSSSSSAFLMASFIGSMSESLLLYVSLVSFMLEVFDFKFGLDTYIPPFFIGFFVDSAPNG